MANTKEKNKTWYVVIVKRSVGIDKYYRKDFSDAINLKAMNEQLYPKAEIELKEADIIK